MTIDKINKHKYTANLTSYIPKIKSDYIFISLNSGLFNESSASFFYFAFGRKTFTTSSLFSKNGPSIKSIQ